MFSKSVIIASLVVTGLLLAACGGGKKSGGPIVQPAANSAPVASPDTARTRPGVLVDVDVLANDRDGEGDAMTIEVPAAHASATFSVVSNRLRVTPSAGYGGTLTFTYRAGDSRGAFSAPTEVTVVVGVQARALVRMGSMVGIYSRFVLAGTANGDTRELLPAGGCGAGIALTIQDGGRRALAQRCAAVFSSRSEIVVSQPRAVSLSEPTVIYGNAPLAPGFSSVGDNEVWVAERTQNPDDLTLPGAYDLAGIDIAQRAVTRRFALTGIDRVSQVRRLGGGQRRVLLTTSDTSGHSALFVADPDAALLQRLSAPGPLPPYAEFPLASPDGRFVMPQWPASGDLRGYDVQAPGAVHTIWTVPGAGPATVMLQIQFVPREAATMLVEVADFTAGETTIWAVPLGTPSEARILAQYPSMLSSRRFLIWGDVLVYVASAGASGFHVRSARISTGAALPTLSPPAGLALNGLDHFSGNTLLLTVFDDQQRSRGALIRVAAPGVMESIAPGLEIASNSMTLDPDETTVGFADEQGSANRRSYVADVNLLSQPVPLQDGRVLGEDAMSVFVFGPPDP